MNRYVHQDTGDDANDGLSSETAWQSLSNSVFRLVAGNTLHVAKASTPYTERFTTVQHGEADNPISLITNDGAVVGGGGWQLDADYWNVAGFHAEAFTGRMLIIGRDRRAHHVNVADFNFFHSVKPGIELWRVEDVAIANCHFRDIRSRELGKDRNALLFKRTANRVLVARCQFEDTGSDGIHVLPNGYYGFCGNIRIEDCHAWTNRPYGSKLWQDVYSGTGEDGFDIKHLDGPLYIRRCRFDGFHVIEGPRDCSSSSGCGSAIQIHCGAREVYVWDVHVTDGRRGVRVNPNVEPSVGPVYIGAFTTEGVEEPISIRPGWEHVVHELSEDPLPDNGNGGNDMGIVETLRAKAAELQAIADAIEAFDVTEIRAIATTIDGAADSLVEADLLADELAEKL